MLCITVLHCFSPFSWPGVNKYSGNVEKTDVRRGGEALENGGSGMSTA